MADVEGGAAAAAQFPTGREAASACGLLSFPQPGLSPPEPVPEPGRVGQTQAGEAQDTPPLEMPPPPGQGLHLLRPTELAFSLPSSPQGCLGVSPPSFPAQDGSSAPSFSCPGSLPVSQILYTVAQRVARLQGKPKAPAVAPRRGLPPTQLGTIQAQEQPEQTKGNERPAPSFARVQGRNESLSRSAENSRGLGLSIANSQIIRLRPFSGCGSQQVSLYNSSEPTVQLLLQRPLQRLGQVSLDKTITPKILKGQKSNSVTAGSPNVTVSACSEDSITNHEKKHKRQKLKRSLKVKTRSGRISRPPKYKAKDYKFIKTKDLADCHQSDSDDYSELSVEEDEEGKGAKAPSLFASLNCDLRPKLFKCQTCEKSYIGKGGLARHYKLNAHHGQQESSQSSTLNIPHSMTLLEDTGKINSESVSQNSSPQPPQSVTLINENALGIDIQKNLPSKQSDTCVEDRIFDEQQNAHLLHMSSRRCRRPRRCCQPKMTERSRYSGRFNRPSQFPCKSLNNISAAQQSVFRRKARLKEIIQQCANEDFMELAIPRFTTLVTVFEFLLMKVGKNCAAKGVFPDVYKQFEELHDMVKKMCQDYFSDPEINNVVEIKNHKVAESLGITDIVRLQKIQVDFSPDCIKNTNEFEVTEILGQKRAAESSEEILPFSKKTRRESLLENVNINHSKASGVKEINSINEGFTPEGSCGTINFSRNKVLEKGQNEWFELENENDYIDPDQICQPVKVESKNSQPSGISGSDHSDNSSSWSEMQKYCKKKVNAEILQVVQINSGWNAASRQYESEVCNSVAPEDAGLTPDLLVLEENDNEKRENQEEAIMDSPVDTCLGLLQGSDQSEKASSMNTVLISHPFGSPIESCSSTSICSKSPENSKTLENLVQSEQVNVQR